LYLCGNNCLSNLRNIIRYVRKHLHDVDRRSNSRSIICNIGDVLGHIGQVKIIRKIKVGKISKFWIVKELFGLGYSGVVEAGRSKADVIFGTVGLVGEVCLGFLFSFEGIHFCSVVIGTFGRVVDGKGGARG